MKNILAALMMIIGLAFAGCAKQAARPQTTHEMKESSKILVAYFSATGTTESVAGKIAEATGGKLLEIEPTEPYTGADLDWNDRNSRSSTEMADAKSRPAIADDCKGLKGYDVIYLGYPIWWDLAPRAVQTFIESNDFKGATVIPFATSGGSTITNSVRQLRADYPDIVWKEGRLLNSASPKEIEAFIGK